MCEVNLRVGVAISAVFGLFLGHNVSAATASDTATIDVTVGSAISMELSTESLDFGTHLAVPVMDLMTKDLTVTVKTNNTSGYKLSMTTPYTDAGLRTEGGEKIPSIASDTKKADFTAAKWGYSLDNGENFSRVPTSADEDTIDSYGSETEGRDTVVTVGMKLNDTVSSGIYKNKLIFTATANTLKIFQGITSMQQMTSAICSGEAVGTETTLRDDRDGNIYTVRKLKDGNCWMTQNLRLGKESMTYVLDETNSDLTGAVEFRLSEPEADKTVWAASATDEAGVNSVHVYSNGANGNLYNWYTAVAGTANFASTGTGNASGTICPKGWTLPVASGDGSFKALMAEYEVTTAEATLSSPLSFVGGGYYTGSQLTGNTATSDTGSYWTKTLTTAARSAESMVIRYASNTIAYGGSAKAGGLYIRCVAK